MTTSLMFAIGFAVAFVVLAVVTIVLQYRKMSNMPNDVFASFGSNNPKDVVKEFGNNFFKGILTIVLCGFFAVLSVVAAIISVIIHFFG